MRWSSLRYSKDVIICLIAVISFVGCKKTDEKTITAKQEKEVPLPKMEETFPFSEAEKIEIISYPVRYEWDTIRDGKREVLAPIVENAKLQFDTLHIKDRVLLDEKLKKQLFKTFFTDNKDCTVAACFDPHHAILFYNRKSEIIAYLEVCIGCGNAQSSNNFEYDQLCVGALGGLFEDAGITYFGEK